MVTRAKKDSTVLSCTHFLWKACWHGNTPSSSFTLKSSRHTAHVCCVSDRQSETEREQSFDEIIMHRFCFFVSHHKSVFAAQISVRMFMKITFLPHEDSTSLDPLSKPPLGGKKQNISKIIQQGLEYDLDPKVR